MPGGAVRSGCCALVVKVCVCEREETESECVWVPVGVVNWVNKGVCRDCLSVCVCVCCQASLEPCCQR